jgi:dihydroorotase
MFTVRNATLADGRTRDVRVDPESGTVDAVGRGLDAERSIEAGGDRLLPGMIDVHVHFREPGAAHKETWGTGSRSAVAGGVTAAIEQPNTDPPTTTGAAYDAKAGLAAGNSLADFGLNGGVTPDWDPESLLDRPLLALGEVFLADSTGEMGIDADLFRAAVRRAAAADLPVTVHAEDATRFDESALPTDPTATGRDADADAWSAYRTAEAEVAAAELAASVAADADAGSGARLHLAHTSTSEAVDVAAANGLTCEATPHHLLLSREDLPDLGTFGRMNPPLRSEDRRAALFERLADGTIDVVATDHAPHTRTEKETTLPEAPSGVPGVETALPLLLAAAEEGRLSYERVRDATAANPAAIFDLPNKGRIAEGMDADLVLVDPGDRTEIRGADLHSKCGWTPFEGAEGVFPRWTAVRGEVIYARDDADLLPALAPADGPFGDAGGENLRP